MSHFSTAYINLNLIWIKQLGSSSRALKFTNNRRANRSQRVMERGRGEVFLGEKRSFSQSSGSYVFQWIQERMSSSSLG